MLDVIQKSRRDAAIRTRAKAGRSLIRREIESVAGRIARSGRASLGAETRTKIRVGLTAMMRERLGDAADTPEGKAYIKEQARHRQAALAETEQQIKRRVGEIAEQGQRKGWSDARTAKEIKGAVKNIATTRAIVIAQNESIHDANFAAVSQAGRGQLLEWHTAGDARVRASHVSVNGERIKPGKRFSNGLKYPGDPFAPAAEVVNCRCYIKVVNE